MKNKVKSLFGKMVLNEVVVDAEEIKLLITFFSEHPEWEEKKGAGFLHFAKVKNNWNQSFAVVDVNRNHQTISMNFTKVLNKKKIVLLAFRNHIEYQIDEVRKKVTYGVDKCEFTGITLTRDNSHIDHYNHDFIDVANMFVDSFFLSYDGIYNYIVKQGVKNYISDEFIVDSFCKFHEENTNLRCVSASFNLSR